jgi:hypothetical protein
MGTDTNGTYLSMLKEKHLPQTTARMQEVEQRRSSCRGAENTEIYIVDMAFSVFSVFSVFSASLWRVLFLK